jgi:hypothetical protein
MTSRGAIKPVIFPETAAEGYFVHARYRDEQLRSPADGTFYVELETAIALAMGWINDRWKIEPESLQVSGVRGSNREILSLAFRFRGVPHCGASRSGFEIPRREKALEGRWQKFWRMHVQFRRPG